MGSVDQGVDPDRSAQVSGASIAAIAAAIASVDRHGFEEALSSLLQVTTGHRSVAIVAFFVPGKPRPLFDNLSRANQERALDPYLAGAYLLDPWYNMVLQRVPDGIYLLAEHAPDGFEQSEYFRQYYTHTGLRDECGIFIRLSAVACLVISLGYYGTPPPAGVDLSNARTLFPSIQALCARHWGDLSSELPDPHATLEDLCRQKGLSGREVEVTAMVLRGYSNKLIARELAISPETVKVYRKRINRKLGTCSTRQIFVDFFVSHTGQFRLK